MEKYVINVNIQDRTDKGFLINMCYVDVEYECGKVENLIGRIYEVTPSGYKSKKDIFADLDIIEESLSDFGQRVFITKECAYMLKNKFPELRFKVYQSAQSRAASANASAWNHIASNYMTDPYDRG